MHTLQTVLNWTRATFLLCLVSGCSSRTDAPDTPAAPSAVATAGAVVVLRPESATADGPDAPPRVTLAQRQPDGTLSSVAGQYLDALEFRDGVAAVTLQRQLHLVHADGSRSLVAKDLDGLPALDGEGSLVYAARFGEVVELYRLRRNGSQQRLASFRGSATRLSPRSDGTVVFIGATRGGVSGIWIAGPTGPRCLTNCDLRVGRSWDGAYRPLPGETDSVRIARSRLEWRTAEGRSEVAPVTDALSQATRLSP